MKRIVQFALKLTDQMISCAFSRVFGESSALIAFLFHGLFRNQKEISLNLVDPLQRITINHFRQFVEYYLNYDYTFISPADILEGLNNYKKYILITFDDGYFSSKFALPILKEYQIPAVFFISANQIKQNKCFWWDVLYRERIKSAVSVKDIMQEQVRLWSKTNEEIERYVIGLLGEKAFNPTSDIDRPFTPSELKQFSQEKYVFLGNHTSDHAVLTNYSPEEIKLQILNAQNTIYDMTKKTPIIISYPNGNYSKPIIRIAKEAGLKLGVTIVPRKNYLPINFCTDAQMCLNRFTLYGNINFSKQCELFRSDIAIYTKIKNLLKNTN